MGSTAMSVWGGEPSPFVQEIDVAAYLDNLLVLRRLDVARRDRVVDALPQLHLDFRILAAAHTHDRALARADDSGDGGHVVADHVMEEKRLVGLIDERCDVPDVDRLGDVDELLCFAQALDGF